MLPTRNQNHVQLFQFNLISFIVDQNLHFPNCKTSQSKAFVHCRNQQDSPLLTLPSQRCSFSMTRLEMDFRNIFSHRMQTQKMENWSRVSQTNGNRNADSSYSATTTVATMVMTMTEKCTLFSRSSLWRATDVVVASSGCQTQAIGDEKGKPAGLELNFKIFRRYVTSGCNSAHVVLDNRINWLWYWIDLALFPLEWLMGLTCGIFLYNFMNGKLFSFNWYFQL